MLDAPIERVWDTLAENERWPDWWRGSERVEVLEPGDADRLGELGRYTWRGPLPYRLTFDLRVTLVDRPHACDATASGDLAGVGRWRLAEAAGGTRVVFDWEVEPTAGWIRALSPLARRLFVYGHDWVMRGGGRGLARRLAG